MSQKMTRVKCDECEHEFILEAVGIHEAIVQLNGVPVTLVYFACPKCNKIYRISIQDKRLNLKISPKYPHYRQDHHYRQPNEQTIFHH